MTTNLAVPLRRMAIVGLLAIGLSGFAAAQTVSFIARHDYAVGSLYGSYVNHVAVGDFNGDGIPDLAVTEQYSNAVFIFLGRGGGLFKSPNSTSSQA